MTPAKPDFNVGTLTIKVGREGNVFEVAFRTPETVRDIDGHGTLVTHRQSASLRVEWYGWQTFLDARYNSIDFSVTGSGDAGYRWAGSQGIYFREKPLQVAPVTLLVGVSTLAGTIVGLLASMLLGSAGKDGFSLFRCQGARW